MTRIAQLLILSMITLGMSNTALADPLLDAVYGDHRLEENVMRDVYRNPYETLSFFGIKQDMTVIESWPGGGWYSEILGAYLKDNGQLIAATYNRNAETQKSWQVRVNKEYDEKIVANKAAYGDIMIVSFSPETGDELASPGSVDAILDFRNAHNWIKSDAVPQAWHSALKTGGFVGIVDHRMGADMPLAADSGYIHEQQLVNIMEKNGFKLVATSEINSNPRDTKNYPSGVWTLPPTLAQKDVLKNKYLAIGESDRLVMKFEKI
jgi:predicted methyltransferase